jgi:hypothetical protein
VGDRTLALSAVALTHRDHGQRARDEQRGDHDGNEPTEPGGPSAARAPRSRSSVARCSASSESRLAHAGVDETRDPRRRWRGSRSPPTRPSARVGPRGAGSSGRVHRRSHSAVAVGELPLRPYVVARLVDPQCRRAQAPISASWAISTVGSRDDGSRSKDSSRCRPKDSNHAVHRLASVSGSTSDRRTRRRVSSLPSPRETSAGTADGTRIAPDFVHPLVQLARLGVRGRPDTRPMSLYALR